MTAGPPRQPGREPSRRTQGGLSATLLEHAVALTRDLGPAGVSLREVQRRSAVSPAAAYRHYRDRDSLMVAVGQYASTVMADTIGRRLAALPPDGSADTAVQRLRLAIHGYLDFVDEEPGLFRALFLVEQGPKRLHQPDRRARDSADPGPFQLLQRCLDDLAELGVLAAADAPWTDTAVWAATHGLAVLLLEGPLRHLADADKQAVRDRLIDVVIRGL